jgi:hypothetical protein
MKEKTELTKLEKGIKVFIKQEEYKWIEEVLKKGWLSYENYPDTYKEIALPDEVGRFLVFRFIIAKE